jgi:glycosyltransferase involved in cell wall biosynthesis
MLNRLQAVTAVRSFNTAPGRSEMATGAVFSAFHSIFIFFKLVVLLIIERPTSVYIGLSGGARQLFDALYILFASITGAKIFIHHHSFAYLNTVKFYNRLCFFAGRKAVHIVLCEAMAKKLAKKFNVTEDRIFVLSNAAFVEGDAQISIDQRLRSKHLVLGFISKITLEKGIERFFDVLKELARRGIKVQGVVAGPIDSVFESQFKLMLEARREVSYVGAVYGEKKNEFFKGIDLLLFPTAYINEAEPVTIHEALSFGVPVIAADRGCIKSIISECCGTVIHDVSNYAAAASDYIENSILGGASLNRLSEGAYGNFNEIRNFHLARLESLILNISNVYRVKA